MKKKLCCLAAVLCFLCASPAMPVSADAGGTLTADAHKVTVALQKPAEEPEAVAAVRFWLSITVQSGETAQPEFQFADTVFGSGDFDGVRSAKVSRQGDQYIADIILSGKRKQDLFQGGSQAVIGTLLLHPSSTDFRAQVAITGAEADGGQPVLRYISSTGSQVQTVPFSNVAPVICTGTAPADPLTPTDPSVPTNPSAPTDPAGTGSSTGTPAPTNPPVPGNSSGTGSSSGTPAPTNPSAPTDPAGTGSSQDSPSTDTNDPGKDNAEPSAQPGAFDKNTSPRLTLSAKNASRKVTFRWSLADGADGYQIYHYDEAAGKYRRLKTIANADTKTYAKSMQYGTAYTFRVRAFQTAKDGTRIYGRFSPAAKVTTPPEAVKGLSVKQTKAKKALLTWKKIKKADGYQIYRSTSKKGAYTRIKTIGNAATVKYAGVQQKSGKTYYYKVRAYVTGADGIRKYGAFSSAKPIVIR